jgi:hypothetical protein
MPAATPGFRAPVLTAMTPSLPAAGSIVPRPLDQHTLMTSGSAIDLPPAGSRVRQAVYIKDPRTVMSVEEGQQILQTIGGRSMSMEPQPTGDWRFSCVVGEGPDQKRFEAKNTDQVEALRAVLWQVKNEK